MTFIQNAWYVVALRREIEDRLFSRRVLGTSVVLYRDSVGKVVALRDRCSHRGYPLSEGTLKDDVITCGYHGFCFSASGECLRVPGQGTAPSRARVRSYPVVENGPFVWIWPGRPELADPSAIPTETGFADDRYTFVSGNVVIEGNYRLVVDNLLDLSHESFIHATKIGTTEVAETPITTDHDYDCWVARAERVMKACECPPTYQARTGLRSPIDRLQRLQYFVPALYLLDTVVEPAAGVNPPPGQPERSFRGKVVYGLTPDTERTTHYFFAIGRDYALGDGQFDAGVYDGQICLIEEDARAIAILQAAAESEGPPEEISVRFDAAALAARRMLDERLDLEAADAAGA